MRIGAMWPRGTGAAVVAVVIVVAACQPYETPGPTGFTFADVKTIAFDSIRTYAHTLEFDTVLGAADRQLMDFATHHIGTGDTAWIYPEKGAWALDPSD